jgi:hypothetical protein
MKSAMSNMQLEDVLAILGRVGTVTLRKGTNDVSASPGHDADTKGWKCEVQLKGYLRPWGHGGPGGSPVSLGGWNAPGGMTASQAAAHTLAMLEQFLESAEGKACRECYAKDYEAAVRRAGPRPASVPVHQWQRGPHPGPMVPEAKIGWGDL